jgi:hypothetical protein
MLMNTNSLNLSYFEIRKPVNNWLCGCLCWLDLAQIALDIGFTLSHILIECQAALNCPNLIDINKAVNNGVLVLADRYMQALIYIAASALLVWARAGVRAGTVMGAALGSGGWWGFNGHRFGFDFHFVLFLGWLGRGGYCLCYS